MATLMNWSATGYGMTLEKTIHTFTASGSAVPTTGQLWPRIAQG